jgi:hypothetical protein
MLALKHSVAAMKAELYTPPIISFVCDSDFNAEIRYNGTKRIYQPEPTLLEFHKSLEENIVQQQLGPYGSGKSTGLNWQVLFCCTQMMPPCKDGVRRSKWVFIRGTYDELKQTTFDLWMSWFGQFGNVKATLKPLEYKTQFYDAEGMCELHVVFLALDKVLQYKKLRSSNFTGGYINESSEAPEGLTSQVLARTGRYPSMDLLDLSKVKKWFTRPILLNEKWQTTRVPYWSGVICDTNPPEVDSEIFNLFEVQKPAGYRLFKQPAGLFKTKIGWAVNPNAENIKRLGLDYYSKQAVGATEEFIKVFCCGEYGSIKAGSLIYDDYNDNFHCCDELPILSDVGLRLSFDTWYNPACNISQYASEQLRVLAALHEPHCSLEAFIHDLILPYLHQNFGGMPIISVVFDPAGMAGENVKGATSDFQIIQKAFEKYGVGIVKPAITNKIKTRLNAVEHLLKRINRAQPAIIFDKVRCNILRQGFLKHYVWRESKTTGEIIHEPKKNKYSHNQDALQYEALSIVGVLDWDEEKPGTYLAPQSYRPRDFGSAYVR